MISWAEEQTSVSFYLDLGVMFSLSLPADSAFQLYLVLIRVGQAWGIIIPLALQGHLSYLLPNFRAIKEMAIPRSLLLWSKVIECQNNQSHYKTATPFVFFNPDKHEHLFIASHFLFTSV